MKIPSEFCEICWYLTFFNKKIPDSYHFVNLLIIKIIFSEKSLVASIVIMYD